MSRSSTRLNIRERPPERFHAFISYTTREDEIREIKPIVDGFLNDYLRPLIETALGEPPIFYDGWYLRNAPGVVRTDYSLRRSLRFAIEESEMLLAFVSPHYVESDWCRFEVETMSRKAPRPWYDICRSAPSDELRDQRKSDMRPSHWHCLMAAIVRRLQGHREATRGAESPIIPIIWKGTAGLLAKLPLVQRRYVFDWTSCGRAMEARARTAEHLWRHGSVSPRWQEEEVAEWELCKASMFNAANAIVGVLKSRRSDYKRIQA